MVLQRVSRMVLQPVWIVLQPVWIVCYAWFEWFGNVGRMVWQSGSNGFEQQEYKVQSLDESECQAQHNSSYAVGYNDYIQTDLAQSNNVYLFYVLTIAPLFSLVVAAEPDILTHRSFELCILVAQNHSICVARPFDSHYKTIRTVLPNHSNCASENHSNRALLNHSNWIVLQNHSMLN